MPDRVAVQSIKTGCRSDLEPAESLARVGDLYGSSAPMLRLYDEIRRVAPTRAPVMIFGESGTGKELVARTLHAQSPRAHGAFVAVNCGAIPRHLLEAELFGYERGSFTGARQQHAGYFERASGGTLFLDEITDMPGTMQVKLLRVLESGRFLRVGGADALDVDVRILSATNRDSQEALRDGAFREDLLYRLAVFPMHVPPLRIRGDDVVGLALHFLSGLNGRAGGNKVFSAAAMKLLAAHHWPGNVRELRNGVQRGFILADDVVDLPDPALRRARPAAHPGRLDVPVGTALADVQREMILATLLHFTGDKVRTADALGISLKTLYNRLNLYGNTSRHGPDATNGEVVVAAVERHRHGVARSPSRDASSVD